MFFRADLPCGAGDPFVGQKAAHIIDDIGEFAPHDGLR